MPDAFLPFDRLAAHVSRIRAAKPAWLAYVQLPDKLSDISDSWKTQMGFEYGPVLSQASNPLLALFGERDTSTPVDATVAALRSGLRAARNARATIRVYAAADYALLIWPEHTTEMELPPPIGPVIPKSSRGGFVS